MASEETITVTGIRIPTQDGGSTMQFHAVRVSEPGPGQGGGSTTTVLTTKEALAEAIGDLGSEDKIILKVGKMTAVIDIIRFTLILHALEVTSRMVAKRLDQDNNIHLTRLN